MKPGLPTTDRHLLELTFGRLRACVVEASDLLVQAASGRYHETRFAISGQSGLRFLLDPGCSTWRAAVGTAGTPEWRTLAEAEQCVVAETTTLVRAESWLEALEWLDGPATTDVDALLTAAIALVGAGSDGLGEVGQTYPVHFLQRRYSAEAFALYALVHHERGRQVLADLGAPALPAPLSPTEGPVAFAQAHKWLAGTDLRWLGLGHSAYAVLGTLVRMLPEFLDGVADPAVVHDYVEADMLDIALNVALDTCPA